MGSGGEGRDGGGGGAWQVQEWGLEEEEGQRERQLAWRGRDRVR